MGGRSQVSLRPSWEAKRQKSECLCNRESRASKSRAFQRQAGRPGPAGVWRIRSDIRAVLGEASRPGSLGQGDHRTIGCQSGPLLGPPHQISSTSMRVYIIRSLLRRYGQCSKLPGAVQGLTCLVRAMRHWADTARQTPGPCRFERRAGASPSHLTGLYCRTSRSFASTKELMKHRCS